MLSDFPESNSLDSEIINEIFEGPIDPQTNNDDIFPNDHSQTNIESLAECLTELCASDFY